jgi:hypothetical protein
LRSFSVVGYNVVFCKITFSESTPMVIFHGWKWWSTMEFIFGQTHRLQRGSSGNQMRQRFGIRRWLEMIQNGEHQNPIGLLLASPAPIVEKKQWSWLYSLCWDKYWLVACIICHVPCPYQVLTTPSTVVSSCRTPTVQHLHWDHEGSQGHLG